MSDYLSEEEIEEIIEYNRKIVTSRNEPFGVDREKIIDIFSSANKYHDSNVKNNRDIVIKKASIIISGIAWEQPFDEGNKRTALAAGTMLINRNGFDLPLENLDVQIEIYQLLNCIVFKYENDSTIYSDVEAFLKRTLTKPSS